MDMFNVHITRAAVDDLDGIPEELRRQIISDIKFLSTSHFPSGSNIKKLKGFKPPLYRLRSGGYRVLYRIQSNNVMIMRVINRRDLERIIKRIKL